MRKWIIGVVCIVILSVATIIWCIYGFSGGRTLGVKREIGPSERYTKKEIQDAMKVVEKKFKADFDDCILKTLEYDEEYSAERSESEAKQYGADQAIVLKSSFYAGEKAAEDGGSMADYTHEGWSWILTKNDGGQWVLRTCGYG